MYTLRQATAPEWVETVLNDLNSFIVDHANAEKKASSMAMTMIAHYPDRKELVSAMVDLALEELAHFKEVYKIMEQRNLQFGMDEKDPYVNQLRKCFRQGSDLYFLDRLLVASVVEARGCERFGLVADALQPGPLKNFYVAITKSEERHFHLFIDLAKLYFPEPMIEQRLDDILDNEASIIRSLPHRAALH
jgi:tRNA-(ms[2]io[6]A)-hydroxylase